MYRLTIMRLFSNSMGKTLKHMYRLANDLDTGITALLQ